MNKICEKLINATGVRIEHHLGVSQYYDGTILLSVFDQSLVGSIAKFVMGRPTDPDWALYHELGHAIADSFEVNKCKDVRRLFGNFNEKYHGNSALFLSSTIEPTEDYLTAYGMTHPEEDWADTVAYVISNYGSIKSPGNTVLSQKIFCVKEWIQAII